VLPRAAGQTVSALRACLRREVARIDAAAAAERLVTAVRDRQVRLEARDDGMSALSVLWATPVGRACYEALSAYAKACEYGEGGNRDPRTHQQRMSDCLADLILRPHADRPAVQVLLTLVAGVDTVTGQGGGAEEPGEVDGDLVPAALVRELAYTLGLLARPEAAADSHTQTDTGRPGHAQDAYGAPSDGVFSNSGDADSIAEGSAGESGAAILGDREREARIAALRAGELAAAEELLTSYDAADGDHEFGVRGGGMMRAALTRLLDTRRLIDTALAERPRIAVVDQLSGTLLGLTDSTQLREAAAAGHGLGPPSGTEAYQPTDSLYRFVRLRDRRCRFPGCRTRARCCDLDHQVPHPHGPTAHDNLACLCEHHHRLSHQAPGWRLHRDVDGSLVWTLPSGLTVTTRPPAFGTDDGSTPAPPPLPRTGRQRYDDALAAIRDSRAAPPDPDVPF
jgi:hypothetical protein